MGFVEWLVERRRWWLARELLLIIGPDVPARVEIGDGLRLQHRARGAVIHPDTVIGRDVTIYHGVTIGRADAIRPRQQSKMERIEIGDGVTLLPGCVVLGGDGVTRIGNGTVIAANAVVLGSTGDHEVWAGVPARRVGSAPGGATS